MYGRGTQGGGGMGFGPPSTPPIVKQLLIVNAAIFVFQLLTGQGNPVASPIARLGAATPALVWQGGYLWQPFTYMFLHGSVAHVLLNMFVLWMFGSPLAMVWGTKRFLRFYLYCGFGAGFIITLVPYALVYLFGWPGEQLLWPTVGASGAIYGLLLAYSFTWPDRTIMLIFPPVAFRAIWLIPITFFMTLLMGGNVSHIGHLGGVLVGWLLLRKSGDTQGVFSLAQLKYRWNRWKMRRRLKAVRQDDESWRRRTGNDRTLH